MVKKKILALVVLMVISMLGGANCFAVDLNNLYNFSDFNQVWGTYAADSVESLKVDGQTGNIYIRGADINDVRVLAIENVKAETKAIVDELMNNIKINSIIDSGVFKINVLSKKDNKDYWTWKANTYPLSSVDIGFVILVPNKFKSFDINNYTGDIKLSNINGALKIINYTGDINIDNANLIGDNTVDIKTGNIITKAAINNAKTLKLTTLTGNVKLNIPKNTGVSIDASLMVGTMGGNFNGGFTGQKDAAGMLTASEVYNGGGTNVTLKTMTGDITVNAIEG